MISDKITTLSLFSGGGGMDLGFSAAGYSICGSTDNDGYSCKTLELNAEKKSYLKKHPVVLTDITKITGTELLSKIGKEASDIDVIIGGPPCQAFSVNGRRGGLNDPRGNLIWEFLRLVKEISPRVFIFENVTGLKTIHDGNLFQKLLKDLSVGGSYAVSVHEYEMADFGIPQYRKRIFFIGNKGNIKIPPMNPTHGSTLFSQFPYVTVGKVLKNMDEPNSSIPNHIGRVHSQAIIDRYASLKLGERDSRTRINKLDPERPSFTIVVGSDAGGGKGHVHPYTPREVTPRESARMQTFPDWWEFFGTGRHVIRQVGNAVPPLFAALIAEHVKHYITKSNNILKYDDFIKILQLSYMDA